jgi:hypothetical protein
MSDREPYRNAGPCPNCESKTLTWERLAARLSEHAGLWLSLAIGTTVTVLWAVLLAGHEPYTNAGPGHVWLAGAASVLTVGFATGRVIVVDDSDSKAVTAGLVIASLHSLTLTMVSAIVCAVVR